MEGVQAEPADALWAFATTFYAEPGIAETCLRLQDEAGVDVCLLLATLWSAVEGPGLLGPVELATLDRAVAPWRQHVVRPLRQARRWLKQASHADDPLRMRLKANELEAERRELAVLAVLLRQAPPLPSGTAGQAVTAFAAWQGCSPADLQPLANAAYRRSR